MSPAALAVITYQRACVSRTPEAFEAASHALARAVGLSPAGPPIPQPIVGRPAAPRLVVDNSRRRS